MFSGGTTLGGGTVGALGWHAGLFDEVLEAAGREHPDHPGAFRADGELVGDVAGAERVLAGSQLDGLVADDDRHAALEGRRSPRPRCSGRAAGPRARGGAVISTSVYWPAVSAAEALTSASMPKNQRGWPRAVGDGGAVSGWAAMGAS